MLTVYIQYKYPGRNVPIWGEMKLWLQYLYKAQIVSSNIINIYYKPVILSITWSLRLSTSGTQHYKALNITLSSHKSGSTHVLGPPL